MGNSLRASAHSIFTANLTRWELPTPHFTDEGGVAEAKEPSPGGLGRGWGWGERGRDTELALNLDAQRPLGLSLDRSRVAWSV